MGPRRSLCGGWGPWRAKIFSMVLSLLAYFFSMITALTVLASLWIGLVGELAFQTIHLQPYPRPVIAEVATTPVTPPKSELTSPADVAAAAVAKAKHIAQAGAHARGLLAQQQREHDNSVALGYGAESGAAFSPPFASPALAPIYPVFAGQPAAD